MGEVPATVIVSSMLPTFSSAFTVAVNAPVSRMPSRRTVAKPVSENVTTYEPGLKSTSLYSPSPSVTTVRTFSMSAGLDASTVTPGRTSPDVSLTTPVMLAWARAGTENRVEQADRTNATKPILQRSMAISLTGILASDSSGRKTSQRSRTAKGSVRDGTLTNAQCAINRCPAAVQHVRA